MSDADLVSEMSCGSPRLWARRYAEMDAADKNKISHRYRALDKLRKFLLEQDS